MSSDLNYPLLGPNTNGNTHQKNGKTQNHNDVEPYANPTHYLEINDSSSRDDVKIIKSQTLSQIYDAIMDTTDDENHETFHYRQFFVYLFYHVLFYHILGPFVVFFFLCIPNGRMIMRNLQFFNCNSFFFNQFGAWGMSLGSILFFIIMKPTGIHFLEVATLNVMIFVRCIFISSKYGSLPASYIKRIETVPITTEELEDHFILGTWRDQTDKKIDAEINESIRNCDVDHNKFIIGFLNHDKAKSIFADIPEKTVAFFLIKTFVPRAQEMFNKGVYICVTLGFSHAIIPCVVYRVLVLEKDFWNVFGCTNPERVMTFFMTLVGGFFASVMCIFVWIAMVDMKRKIFLMEQMTHILSRSKHSQTDNNKLLPLIDITCPVSLKGWFILRDILDGYGRSYDIRHQINTSTCLIIALCDLGVLLFRYFGVFLNRDTPFIFIQCIFELTLSVLFFSILLFNIAKMNSYFDKHTQMLEELKAMNKDVNRFYTKSFEPNGDLPKNELYRAYIEKLKIKYTDKETNKVDYVQLNANMQLFDDTLFDLINILKNQAKYKPYTLLGINITYDLLSKVLWGLCSLIFAVVSKMLLDQSKPKQKVD